MSERIRTALASRSAARLWLALVALSQLAGIPDRPRQEGPHVYLADLRLTRTGDGWVAARLGAVGYYHRICEPTAQVLSAALSRG